MSNNWNDYKRMHPLKRQFPREEPEAWLQEKEPMFPIVELDKMFEKFKLMHPNGSAENLFIFLRTQVKDK